MVNSGELADLLLAQEEDGLLAQEERPSDVKVGKLAKGTLS